MKKTILLYGFLTLIITKNFAQTPNLEAVTIEELTQKAYPQDTTAPAAFLFRTAKTYYVYTRTAGYQLYHDYFFRIKIYKKTGLSWATYKIYAYAKSNEINGDKVNFADCYTYNLGSKNSVEKTKLLAEGIFSSNYNEHYNQFAVAMPNVREGSIIDIKYTIKASTNGKFPTFDFQKEIPVLYAEYITDIPEIYVYKTFITGYFPVNKIQKLISEKESISYDKNDISPYNLKYVYNKFDAQNIPALSNEEYVDNLDNYTTSIYNEIERTRFPGQEVRDLSNTWEGVAKSIYKDEDFGRELRKNNYFEDSLNVLLAKATTDFEKMNTIFKFVQDKMSWDNKYGVYTNKGVKKAFEENSGNLAEINLILIAMLQKAGLKTNPVLTSTVDHGIPVFPSRAVFNNVIAAVQIGEKQYLLDASDKFSAPNILPLRDLNWNGRLIQKDGSNQEIALMPIKVSEENVSITTQIQENKNVISDVKILRTDYESLEFKKKLPREKEARIEKTEREFNNAQIDNYTFEDIVTEEGLKTLESFKVTSNNEIEIINGKMYISPMLFFQESKNPFNQENRTLPVYFGFPKSKKRLVLLQIPKGYKIESLPKAIKMTTEDKSILFSFQLEAVENSIQILQYAKINQAIYEPDYYSVLKEFFQKMIEKQKEKIILIKS